MAWVALAWFGVLLVAEVVARVVVGVRLLVFAILLLPRSVLRRRRAIVSTTIGLVVLTMLSGFLGFSLFVPSGNWLLLGMVAGAALAASALQSPTDAIHFALIDPVIEAIKASTWSEGWKEKEYRAYLLERINIAFGVNAQIERPMPSGTRVDLFFEYDDVEFYITVKHLLSNQQRLVLQGEIEDILDEVRSRGTKEYHIVIVVGLGTGHEGRHQLDELDRKTIKRVAKESGETGATAMTSLVEILVGGRR